MERSMVNFAILLQIGGTTIVMFTVCVMKELCYVSWISPWPGILQHTVLTLIPYSPSCF
jgi:hypothetical protein